MPEFEQRKRKTMSQQELYDEYYDEGNTSRKKAPAKKNNSNKKPVGNNNSNKKPVEKNNSSRRENPPVSSEKKRKQQELSQKQTAAKKSKTYTGKTSGKAPKSKTSSQTSSHSPSHSNSYSNSNSNSHSGSNSHSSSHSASGNSRSSSASRNVKNKKKRTGRYTLYYVLIGILAVVVLTVLSTTVLFNIGVFVVSGETVYTDEEIIEASGIKKGENLLRIDASQAEEDIVSKLVYIESAELHRGFPNRLTISVEPAKPVIAFAYGGKYYVISENKRLLEIADTPLNCPVVKGVQIILQPEEEQTEQTTDSIESTDISVPTAKEGITLENGEREIKPGVVFGDDNENRIKIALNIVSLMEQNGLTKNYEVNLADTLSVKINYDGHIQIELGTTASLEEKIYHASRIIEEDIAEDEHCILNITNPNRAVKRPVYENGSDNPVTTEPEATDTTQTTTPEA